MPRSFVMTDTSQSLPSNPHMFGGSCQRFKLYHDIMQWKVNRLLLVSNPYDAWILDRDQPLLERMIHRYHGLNCTKPPKITTVHSASDAFIELDTRKYDLVITVPLPAEMDAFELGRQIKRKTPDLPVVLLGHHPLPSLPCFVEGPIPEGIDRIFVWNGNPDVLTAIIKDLEDRKNVGCDTEMAGIRVILFIEDSPQYLSSFLPMLYRELMSQTQAVVDQGLDEEHRLLLMRARPKILVAQSFEQALSDYRQYSDYILAVISDGCFSRNGRTDNEAGLELLRAIRADRSDMPLLLISSDPTKEQMAQSIPASFTDKNSGGPLEGLRAFLREKVGFGPFVFKTPDQVEVARASNLRTFEQALRNIPDDSLRYHALRNDFSRWLYARAEIELASSVHCLIADNDDSWSSYRDRVTEEIQTARRRRLGIITNFDCDRFDELTEFAKIGKGSMGGKARGLAFLSTLLLENPSALRKYSEMRISIPRTLILTTDVFDEFVTTNGLSYLAKVDATDEQVADQFLSGTMPVWVSSQLSAYLNCVTQPLAVRSSGLLEDARARGYAGLYKTYFLPNDSEDPISRLDQLIAAVKLVYASTYFQSPKEFSKRVGNRTEQEKMGVIIQEVTGSRYHDYFYPTISGVAQSRNYYPFSKMKPEDGIAAIALGIGLKVVQGTKTVRFSPKNPELALQVQRLDDYLRQSQDWFYAVELGNPCVELGVQDTVTLTERHIVDAVAEYPVELVSSSYIPDENRLNDSVRGRGYPVVTFAKFLKHGLLPLGDLIFDLLTLGSQGMGCPVEMEFTLNIPPQPGNRPEFYILQIRPMASRDEIASVNISPDERDRSFLASSLALGNCVNESIRDIVFVDPRTFDLAATMEVAEEISKINRVIASQGRKYLLVGPGRWGSADRWLGIPVQWRDISAVQAIAEVELDDVRVDPSQGSHFFHNITTLGINYLTVGRAKGDRIDWDFLRALPVTNCTKHATHISLDKPLVLKVDGRTGRSVAYL